LVGATRRVARSIEQWRTSRRLVPTVAIFLLLTGCAPKPPTDIRVQDFSGERAYRHVEKQVAFGSRPSGSAALTNSAAYIVAELKTAGLEVEEQEFSAGTPQGPVRFRNIIGRTRDGRGGDGKVLVFGAHYDTKWMTNMTFVGANDGGSGTAVLLEMARVATQQPNLWFVFFDGEEAVAEYDVEDGLQGSRYFVENLKAEDHVKWVKAMVLFDMVGDKNLNITLPADCTATLVDAVFKASRETGCRDTFGFSVRSIYDDHVPFLNAGIPAVDIIDFDFGSAPGLNDYWHTAQDTLDKISPHSLELVGQVGLRLVPALREQR